MALTGTKKYTNVLTRASATTTQENITHALNKEGFSFFSNFFLLCSWKLDFFRISAIFGDVSAIGKNKGRIAQLYMKNEFKK